MQRYSGTKSLALAAAVAAAFFPAAVLATNGYFQHGYGVKSAGMGGVGIALPQDSIAPASNPAGIAFLERRFDIGLTWFRPSRSATISGIPDFGPPFPNFNGTFDGNGKSNFFIPEIGYSNMINPQLAAGVAIYGNGGMNTRYETPIPLFGTSNPGVDLSQLFVAPTLAYKIAPNHSIGASLNFAYQRFKATGLQNFAAYSSSPDNLTDRGYDNSYGFGVRVGYTGKLAPTVTVGATYQSKTWMSKFDKYKGLFAEQGAFDIPANYGAGIAFKPTPAATLAFDVVRIEYSGIAAINNPLLPNFAQAPLGADGGAGFGWKDVTAYKFGVDYAFTPNFTLRAGYNYGKQPIPASQAMFNILAPGLVESHYTVGGTWTLQTKNELSFFFMYAPRVTLNGTGAIPTAPLFGQPPGSIPNGNVDLRLKEFSFGAAYSWRF